MLNVTWPEHYPQDCPLSDAKPPAGVFYRLVVESAPAVGDLMSLHEMGRRCSSTALECIHRGLSLYADRVDAERTMSRYKDKWKGCVQVQLDGAPGLLCPTPMANDSHHTWWLPVEADRNAVCGTIFVTS